jgi:hypothetical protein
MSVYLLAVVGDAEHQGQVQRVGPPSAPRAAHSRGG